MERILIKGNPRTAVAFRVRCLWMDFSNMIRPAGARLSIMSLLSKKAQRQLTTRLCEEPREADPKQADLWRHHKGFLWTGCSRFARSRVSGFRGKHRGSSRGENGRLRRGTAGLLCCGRTISGASSRMPGRCEPRVYALSKGAILPFIHCAG